MIKFKKSMIAIGFGLAAFGAGPPVALANM